MIDLKKIPTFQKVPSKRHKLFHHLKPWPNIAQVRFAWQLCQQFPVFIGGFNFLFSLWIIPKKFNPISKFYCSGLFVDKSETLGENEIICWPLIKAVFKVLKFVDTLFNQNDWEKKLLDSWFTMAATRLRTQHIIFKVNFTTGKVSEFLENR